MKFLDETSNKPICKKLHQIPSHDKLTFFPILDTDQTQFSKVHRKNDALSLKLKVKNKMKTKIRPKSDQNLNVQLKKWTKL